MSFCSKSRFRSSVHIFFFSSFNSCPQKETVQNSNSNKRRRLKKIKVYIEVTTAIASSSSGGGDCGGGGGWQIKVKLPLSVLLLHTNSFSLFFLPPLYYLSRLLYFFLCFIITFFRLFFFFIKNLFIRPFLVMEVVSFLFFFFFSFFMSHLSFTWHQNSKLVGQFSGLLWTILKREILRLPTRRVFKTIKLFLFVLPFYYFFSSLKGSFLGVNYKEKNCNSKCGCIAHARVYV